MRHRLLVLCTAMLLFFSACRRQPTADPLAIDFSCHFRAQYADMTAAGTLTRRTAGTLLLEFSEPETLNGLSADWDGETVTLRYKGLSFDVDPSKLPESALGEQLILAFDAALRSEGTHQAENGTVTITGGDASSPYTLVYDAKTGMPVSLSAPNVPLTVTFTAS